MRTPLVAAVVLLLFSRSAHSIDQREFGRQAPCEITADVLQEQRRLVDSTKAEIRNLRDARQLLNLFFDQMKDGTHQCLELVDQASNLSKAEEKCKDVQTVDVDAEDFYAIIHVLSWNDPAGGAATIPVNNPNQPPATTPSQPQVSQPPAGQPNPPVTTGNNDTQALLPQDATIPPSDLPNANGSVLGPTPGGVQTVAKQNWYVYHTGGWSQDDFATRKHIPGNQHVWVIYIHLNRQSVYEVNYNVDITKTLPAPWRNLRDLAQLVVATRPTSGRPDKVWGGACIPVNSLPSQIAIEPQFILSDGKSEAKSLGDVTNFDNEGAYRFDFGVGVPVQKIDQLEFSSNNNRVEAKQIDKQQIFGLVDFFFKPVDFKRQTFSRYPFLVAGVGLTGKPLDRILVGLGWGTQLASIYAGVVRVKQEEPETLNPGDTATPEQLAADIRSEHEEQFVFGIHLSARAVLDRLKTNPSTPNP